ncbi:MAG: tRNA isopentenyl-2-thiomethyl-A-37 hydroxylase MiaE, partial [Shewanella sp.]
VSVTISLPKYAKCINDKAAQKEPQILLDKNLI